MAIIIIIISLPFVCASGAVCHLCQLLCRCDGSSDAHFDASGVCLSRHCVFKDLWRIPQRRFSQAGAEECRRKWREEKRQALWQGELSLEYVSFVSSWLEKENICSCKASWIRYHYGYECFMFLLYFTLFSFLPEKIRSVLSINYDLLSKLLIHIGLYPASFILFITLRKMLFINQHY